jgi:hypothetical protein
MESLSFLFLLFVMYFWASWRVASKASVQSLRCFHISGVLPDIALDETFTDND